MSEIPFQVVVRAGAPFVVELQGADLLSPLVATAKTAADTAVAAASSSAANVATCEAAALLVSDALAQVSLAATYPTKAAAAAALGSIPTNGYVQVLEDEVIAGHRTLYQKTDEALVFRLDYEPTFVSAGLGAQRRLVSDKLADTTHVRDFGAATTVSASANATAFASAFSAAQGSNDDAVVHADGQFNITSIAVPSYGKLVSGSGRIYRDGSTGALVTVQANVLETGVDLNRCAMLTNLALRSHQSGTIRTGTGVQIENNATIRLSNISVQGAVIAFHFDRAQFAAVN